MGRGKVLVVGGTCHIGRRIVKACLAQGYETYVLLQRNNIGLDANKLHILLSFKKEGARLVEGSVSDYQSLVEAVKLVDVVISTMNVTPLSKPTISSQLKLIEAIKEAGNVKRFLPSEFGMDPSKMENALEPGSYTFDEKMMARKAIEEAQIPYTYIIANCFGTFFVGNLCQLSILLPPKENVVLYGDGNVKACFMDEVDVATYAVKTIDDPRAENKTIYVKPPDNVLSQRELVEMWEKLSGKQLNKRSISAQEFLAPMKDSEPMHQVGIGHFYHIFYEGCLTNFDVKEDEEASKLYPEVEYTRMDDYLKRYL